MSESSNLIESQWDAVIVGTGIGGATLGYALARAGRRVLFCERGDRRAPAVSLAGEYPESHADFALATSEGQREALSLAGRYSHFITDCSATRRRQFIPFMGSGLGGSSALYGMAMERLFPIDFVPGSQYPNAPDASLPAAWPISYEELAPYYTAAEQLYRVCGAGDPLRASVPRDHLRPPPQLSPVGTRLEDFLSKQALHPYRVPMACEFVPGCQCCQGYLCPNDCKCDSGRICVQPAIANHAARLLDRCDVLWLEATSRRVTGVVCEWRGKRHTLRGKVIVLAAGALESAAILLRSASSTWPHGLANESGLVGRNLMRHFNDLYAVFLPGMPRGFDNRRKEIAFNDFYQLQDQKLGSVQSFGRLPPAPMLADSMHRDLRQSAMSWTSPLFELLKPALGAILRRVVDKSVVLATIIEDLPYSDNRVELLRDSAESSAGSLAIKYRIHPYDVARIKALRALMAGVLRPHRYLLIKQAENNQMLAHACGTCRFGSDPRTSVLNSSNRAHGVDNLYVVDSSFFPSSGGTNPSLTIAANALRVCDKMVAEFG